MRSTQLQTLRAVAAGADTFEAVSRALYIPHEYAVGRVRRLEQNGYLRLKHEPQGPVPSHRDWTVLLTDRARALLEARARIDGESYPAEVAPE